MSYAIVYTVAAAALVFAAVNWLNEDGVPEPFVRLLRADVSAPALFGVALIVLAITGHVA